MLSMTIPMTNINVYPTRRTLWNWHIGEPLAPFALATFSGAINGSSFRATRPSCCSSWGCGSLWWWKGVRRWRLWCLSCRISPCRILSRNCLWLPFLSAVCSICDTTAPSLCFEGVARPNRGVCWILRWNSIVDCGIWKPKSCGRSCVQRKRFIGILIRFSLTVKVWTYDMRIYLFSVLPCMPARSCVHSHFRRLRQGSNTLDPITKGDLLPFLRHLLLVSLGLRPGCCRPLKIRSRSYLSIYEDYGRGQ